MESPEASATPDAEQSLIGGSGPSASPSAAAPPPLRTLYPLWAMAFCLNCKPSEPYLARFLMEAKNLTEDQLNHEVWPWSTWGSLLFLLPVGMLAEHVGYRRVILGGLVCREATRVLLLFTSSVFWMATMQLTYAGVMAVQPIFLAYAYVIVAPEHYALATGGVHGACESEFCLLLCAPCPAEAHCSRPRRELLRLDARRAAGADDVGGGGQPPGDPRVCC